MTEPQTSPSERDLQVANAWLDRAGIADAGPPPKEMYRVVAAATRCGLCGGYGALNEVTKKPVPCMACGKESEGMVLIAVDPFDQAEPGEQRGGLRVIDGGKS